MEELDAELGGEMIRLNVDSCEEVEELYYSGESDAEDAFELCQALDDASILMRLFDYWEDTIGLMLHDVIE